MTLIIIEPPREGFGADRFLIRNGARARNAQAIALRPFIQELPERLVDPAQFPQPGRRGPSRVAATFPRPSTTREQTETLNLTPEGIEHLLGGEARLPCVPDEVYTFYQVQAVATGATSRQPSLRFAWPFRITHIQAWTLTTPSNVGVNISVGVAPGDGLVGVVPAGLINVINFQATPGEVLVNVDETPIDFFPNFAVSSPDWHIHVLFTNVNSTLISIAIIVEVEKLG